MAPAIGDRVFHDGYDDFQVVALATKKGQELATFENHRARVGCAAKDLVYSEAKGAWYLPGRVFTRERRLALRPLVGDVLEFERQSMAISKE